MVYGIISQLDDVTTQALFQSKRISKDKIYPNTSLNALVNEIKSGDVVWVVSLNRFLNLSQLRAFAGVCHEMGVSLRFLSEPYLDIWNGKCWKNSFIKLVDQMIMLERCAKGKMRQDFQMTDEQWRYVNYCFETLGLQILAQIFSAEGVLKRGS